MNIMFFNLSHDIVCTHQSVVLWHGSAMCHIFLFIQNGVLITAKVFSYLEFMVFSRPHTQIYI